MTAVVTVGYMKDIMVEPTIVRPRVPPLGHVQQPPRRGSQ
jgi:hypothetical protein